MPARLLALVVLLAGPALGAGPPPLDLFAAIRDHAAVTTSPWIVGSLHAYRSTRHVARTTVPSSLEVPVTVPPNAVLKVGFAVLPDYRGEDVVARARPVRFRVELLPDAGPPATLLERVVDIRDRPADRRWFAFRLDLAAKAGTAGRLRLSQAVAADPTSAGVAVVAWTRPVLYDRVAEAKLPNLVFVTIDALRADHLGSYGYSRPTSPNLDALAAGGVRFAKAFTNAPMTVPSLPQILTSRYFPTRRDPDLATVLYAGGVPATKAIVRNVFLSLWFVFLGRDAFDSTVSDAHRADQITRLALRWIDAHRDERFALYLHYLDTHTPYRVPAEHARLFLDPAYRGPIGRTFTDTQGARAGRYEGADRQRIIDLYDGAIHFVDAQVGRLVDGLRARGLLDDTLIVVTADHGEELWDHGHFFHGQSLYDELLHVPLLVHVPGGEAGGHVVEKTVRTADVLPTIAATLGLPAPSDLAGKPLLGPDGEPAVDADREVFAHAGNPEFPQRVARRPPDHKLIVTVEDGTEQLYDLRADPGERTDLAARPESRPVLEALRRRLAGYRAPLRDRDYQVRARSTDARPHAIELVVETPGGIPLSDPDRVDLPPGDRLVLSPDARTLTWTGTTGAEPAGIRFEHGGLATLAPDDRLRFRVLVDGQPAPPAAIRLGAAGTHPPAAEFDHAAGKPDLAAATPPSLEGGDTPVVIAVWHAGAPEGPSRAPVSPEDRARLRALGYVQ
jgi:arylsulfatase A-like enzyme